MDIPVLPCIEEMLITRTNPLEQDDSEIHLRIGTVKISVNIILDNKHRWLFVYKISFWKLVIKFNINAEHLVPFNKLYMLLYNFLYLSEYTIEIK